MIKRKIGSDIRSLFPQLARTVRGRQLVYLDNAATTLKPKPVIEAVNWNLTSDVSNIHRAAHFLGSLGTTQYEAARESVREFLGANSSEEIVFTKGTTDGLNILAELLGRTLKADDVVLLSEMEHHSNIVPWQLAAQKYGFKLEFIAMTQQGELDQEDFHKKLNSSVKVMSLTHVSNALGTINPIANMIASAKKFNTLTIVDAAQSVAMGMVDVNRLNCDFLVFSGHKLFGPTGVGILYGKRDLLFKLPPYQGGGSMISEVTLSGSTFLNPPHRFEAGTPAIAEVIGLGAALEFVNQLSWEEVREHEKSLMAQLLQKLSELDDLVIYGNPGTSGNVLSMNLKDVHSSDVGQLLDQQGVAVRTGHHCCQPLMRRLGIEGTVRVSLSIYSDQSDVDAFIAALKKAKEILK